MTEREQAIEFLQSQNILTLATVAEGELPSATPLFYLLHGGICLYWVSSASSLHSRNLVRGREVAAAVYAATDRWKKIHGVQMRGSVHIITDSQERKEVLRSYAERFHLGRVLRVAMSQSMLYKLVPSWIRLIDNSRRFGYNYEFKLYADDEASGEK